MTMEIENGPVSAAATPLPHSATVIATSSTIRPISSLRITIFITSIYWACILSDLFKTTFDYKERL